MNRACLWLTCYVMAVYAAMASPAGGNGEDPYEVMADRLGASPPFRAWVAAISSHQGWRVPEARKANHNRVRIHGVCWTPEAIVVAMPRQALTVDGQPAVRSVFLEPGGREMRRVVVEDFPRDDVVFWMWCGNAPSDRFQFSLDLEQGPLRWG